MNAALPRPLWFWSTLLAVLCAHLMGLSWLQGRLPKGEPLTLMPDPIFTRIITPTRPARVLHKQMERPESGAGSGLKPLPVAEEAVPAVVPEQTAPAQVDASQTQIAEPPAIGSNDAVPDAAAAASDGWPADTRLSYRLGGYYRGNLYGSARVQWQREESRYQVRVDISLALLRVSMTSQGEVRVDTLLPRVYEEQFPWGVRRMAFDGAMVKFDNGMQQPQPPFLQDTASQFVELTHRFASGLDQLRVGRQVSLWLARPQGMGLWTYDVIEEELLQTPELGAVSAFHLRPRPIANPTGVITAELWFAPTLQYLPVRVRVDLGDGNFVDLMVERIEQGGAGAPETGLRPRM